MSLWAYVRAPDPENGRLSWRVALSGADTIFEIRDYTIEPGHFGAYKAWALDKAVPWLRAHLDVVDFWLDDGFKAEVSGSDSQVSVHGQPNVCWVIRWPSKAERDSGFEAFSNHPEWQAIWAEHPCPDGYLHMNARFMRAVR